MICDAHRFICFLNIWGLRRVTEFIGNAPPYWRLSIRHNAIFCVNFIITHMYPTSFCICGYINQRESHFEWLYLICDLVRLVLLVLQSSNNIHSATVSLWILTLTRIIYRWRIQMIAWSTYFIQNWIFQIRRDAKSKNELNGMVHLNIEIWFEMKDFCLLYQFFLRLLHCITNNMRI